ncbi:MAG: enoyl-CoA hydratase/isomerase family protein [Solirubrobacterales bacterium]|nr:enoyl-CoA hydratase/isomerase family protein [Solirubrobacterales bacterium]
MSGDPVVVEYDGPLAVVTLNHPPHNLFDKSVMTGYGAALDTLKSDLPRGVLFRAEGAIVSGGVDVSAFDGLTPAEGAGLFEQLLSITHRVEALPVPTVFAAHSLCLTAAFELSLACDIILATPSARFGLVETVVGLTPAMGGTQRIAERAGPGRARELVMTAELFDAVTLERWNVVNRVLAEEGFDANARAFAMRLANGPTLAHAATKTIVRAFLNGGVVEADAAVPTVAGALFETEDLRAAVTSFLEEGPGKATYKGR